MPELLTAKDVELKMFKKVSFGGYSIPDVEEFLNRVAEDLEAYAMRSNDQQRRVYELEEALKRHEAMKDTIKDALILAQQSARSKEEEAKRQAALILAQAEAKIGEIDELGRRRLDEAENEAALIIKSAEDMKEELQKRLAGIEAEISRRMDEADEKAGDIMAGARLEAKRTSEKARQDTEEYKREMASLIAGKRDFLRESEALASAFLRMTGEASEKLNEQGEPLSPEDDLDPGNEGVIF